MNVCIKCSFCIFYFQCTLHLSTHFCKILDLFLTTNTVSRMTMTTTNTTHTMEIADTAATLSWCCDSDTIHTANYYCILCHRGSTHYTTIIQNKTQSIKTSKTIHNRETKSRYQQYEQIHSTLPSRWCVLRQKTHQYHIYGNTQC